MWEKYRKLKHVAVMPLAALAWWLLTHGRELTLVRYLGLLIGVLLGVAYLVEEIVWISLKRGRPCGNCGKRVRLQSFSVQSTCPHCGRTFD